METIEKFDSFPEVFVDSEGNVAFLISNSEYEIEISLTPKDAEEFVRLLNITAAQAKQINSGLTEENS